MLAGQFLHPLPGLLLPLASLEGAGLLRGDLVTFDATGFSLGLSMLPPLTGFVRLIDQVFDLFPLQAGATGIDRAVAVDVHARAADLFPAGSVLPLVAGLAGRLVAGVGLRRMLGSVGEVVQRPQEIGVDLLVE